MVNEYGQDNISCISMSGGQRNRKNCRPIVSETWSVALNSRGIVFNSVLLLQKYVFSLLPVCPPRLWTSMLVYLLLFNTLEEFQPYNTSILWVRNADKMNLGIFFQVNLSFMFSFSRCTPLCEDFFWFWSLQTQKAFEHCSASVYVSSNTGKGS
jgi:hypothetical protein